MHWLHSNSRRVLVFTVGALIALGGIAYATIPDLSGLISACYSSTSGALRVIDSAAKCSAAERALSWNQTGPAGAQGPQGLKGDTGAAGAQGLKGDTGAAGAQGSAGPTGAAGTTGQHMYVASTISSTQVACCYHPTPIAGLSVTLTVPPSSMLLIVTDGVVATAG